MNLGPTSVYRHIDSFCSKYYIYNKLLINYIYSGQCLNILNVTNSLCHVTHCNTPGGIRV